MNFKPKYTRLGNKFFFISNLSEWHFSCVKEYNEFWLNKTGGLNKQEKRALKKFTPIVKKYNFGIRDGKHVWLGIPFIVSSPQMVWKNVGARLNKKEYEEIKEIFQVFEKRFNDECHCKGFKSFN